MTKDEAIKILNDYDINFERNTPEEVAEAHKMAIEAIKTDKALDLLTEWVTDCDFGFDNIPEEYEKYKDDIEDMGYCEGLIYIVKKESEAKE